MSSILLCFQSVFPRRDTWPGKQETDRWSRVYRVKLICSCLIIRVWSLEPKKGFLKGIFLITANLWITSSCPKPVSWPVFLPPLVSGAGVHGSHPNSHHQQLKPEKSSRGASQDVSTKGGLTIICTALFHRGGNQPSTVCTPLTELLVMIPCFTLLSLERTYEQLTYYVFSFLGSFMSHLLSWDCDLL